MLELIGYNFVVWRVHQGTELLDRFYNFMCENYRMFESPHECDSAMNESTTVPMSWNPSPRNTWEVRLKVMPGLNSVGAQCLTTELECLLWHSGCKQTETRSNIKRNERQYERSLHLMTTLFISYLPKRCVVIKQRNFISKKTFLKKSQLVDGTGCVTRIPRLNIWC